MIRKFLIYIKYSILSLLIPFVAFAQIDNPIRYGTLREFLEAMLGVIIQIAVPIIVIMVIYAGFLFVTAGGKPEKLATAKKTILWTLVGAMIILAAQAISIAIQGTVDDITGVEVIKIINRHV